MKKRVLIRCTYKCGVHGFSFASISILIINRLNQRFSLGPTNGVGVGLTWLIVSFQRIALTVERRKIPVRHSVLYYFRAREEVLPEQNELFVKSKTNVRQALSPVIFGLIELEVSTCTTSDATTSELQTLL